MGTEPRIRVSAILRWKGRVLLCRHEKPGKEYWLLPGGGVHSGESLVDALHRELSEEIGLEDQLPLEGPVAIVDSISPARAFAAKHVVHIIFACDLGERSLEFVTSLDDAVRGHSLFGVGDLDDVVLHPPIQRFLSRWQPGDPAVYLGALWAP
jgi:ADP-ribose pyrophosphatase YjhB (NUDIX family)